MIQILQGDSLQLLRQFEPDTFGGVITDPPYSSGGSTTGSKLRPTAEKYTRTKKRCPYPDFEGDCKDQRSWTSWMAEWLAEARRASKPGAPIAVFSDWRQLPSLTDALQWAGWIWRGVLSWDKTNARPQKGRFRQQCEFIAWGSNGDMPVTREVPVLPGIYRYSMPAEKDRYHQTQKPVELMRELVKIVVRGGHILDPFAGSGSTLVAADLEGYSATGIELVPGYAAVSEQRTAKNEEARLRE